MNDEIKSLRGLKRLNLLSPEGEELLDDLEKNGGA